MALVTQDQMTLWLMQWLATNASQPTPANMMMLGVDPDGRARVAFNLNTMAKDLTDYINDIPLPAFPPSP